MALNEKDIEDIKLSRPVAVVDIWDLDDRISRLEEVADQLGKAVRTLVTLYHEERVKSWELILNQMMKERDRKNEQRKQFKP